jgi:hypothetical protein
LNISWPDNGILSIKLAPQNPLFPRSHSVSPE